MSRVQLLCRGGITSAAAALVLAGMAASADASTRGEPPARDLAAPHEKKIALPRLKRIAVPRARALPTLPPAGPILREGYRTPERGVRAVDGLLTGWHEPDASHLLLLEAIAGRPLLDASYAAATAAGYRRHEFGDLHLLLP